MTDGGIATSNRRSFHGQNGPNAQYEYRNLSQENASLATGMPHNGFDMPQDYLPTSVASSMYANPASSAGYLSPLDLHNFHTPHTARSEASMDMQHMHSPFTEADMYMDPSYDLHYAQDPQLFNTNVTSAPNQFLQPSGLLSPNRTSNTTPSSIEPRYAPNLVTANLRSSTPTVPSPRSVHSAQTYIPPNDYHQSYDEDVVRQGVAPMARPSVNEAAIPTLDEQQKERELQATKGEVSSWLRTTTSDSPNTGALPRGMSPQDAYHLRKATLLSDIGDDEYESEDEDELPDCPPTPPLSHARVVQSKFDLRNQPADNISSAYQSSRHFSDSVEPDDPAQDVPESSTAAMQRFDRLVKEMDEISLAATYASSRRRSMADSDSVFSGFSSRVGSFAVSNPMMQPMVPQSRRESFIRRGKEKINRVNDRIQDIRKRTRSNVGERRPIFETRAESDGSAPIQGVKKTNSWGSKKPISLHDGSNTATPAPKSRLNILRRSRSRSDVANSAIAQQWRSSGGPPVSPLAGPSTSKPQTLQLPTEHFVAPADEDDDDEGASTPKAEPILRLEIPVDATLDSFKAHILLVAPDVEPDLVDRLAKEQVVRFERLMQLQELHEKAQRHGACKSRELCRSKSGGVQFIRPRRTKAKDTPSPIYKVQASIPNEAIKFLEPDETPQLAVFPFGIPLPPVQQFPAEFECPICFRVKRMLKPSDWSKHCYEDIHPFTCSFADCPQPKSFNRKADWGRHENETHRQLESWHCSEPGCNHSCHRRDNFVQHLTRVHSMDEPRSSNGRRRGFDDGSEVSRLVRECHREENKDPASEPCRFCGNRYETWKELTAHLAKHMTQISLPILVLVAKAAKDKFGNTHGQPDQYQSAVNAWEQNVEAERHSQTFSGTKNLQIVPQYGRHSPTYPPPTLSTSNIDTSYVDHPSFTLSPAEQPMHSTSLDAEAQQVYLPESSYYQTQAFPAMSSVYFSQPQFHNSEGSHPIIYPNQFMQPGEGGYFEGQYQQYA